jgi:ankyrin repeat protein
MPVTKVTICLSPVHAAPCNNDLLSFSSVSHDQSYVFLKGLNINTALEDGYTPMHLSVRNNNDGAARALVDLKADLDAETPNGHQPLARKESIIRKIHNLRLHLCLATDLQCQRGKIM